MEVGQAEAGKFFLIRTGEATAVIKLTEHTQTGDGGAKYECYWQSASSTDYASVSVQASGGEVYENYERTPRPQGGFALKDAGGQLFVNCGPFTIPWSISDWIYFPSRKDVAIAFTPWSDLSEVNFSDPSLEWLTPQ